MTCITLSYLCRHITHAKWHAFMPRPATTNARRHEMSSVRGVHGVNTEWHRAFVTYLSYWNAHGWISGGFTYANRSLRDGKLSNFHLKFWLVTYASLMTIRSDSDNVHYLATAKAGERLSTNKHNQQGVNERIRWSRGSVPAFGTQVRGFKPTEAVWFFRAKKENPQHAFLLRESKAVCPMS